MMLTVLMWIGIVLLAFLALVSLGSLAYVFGIVLEALFELIGVAFAGALLVAVVFGVVRVIQYIGTL